jgi:hypothetical protein
MTRPLLSRPLLWIVQIATIANANTRRLTHRRILFLLVFTFDITACSGQQIDASITLRREEAALKWSDAAPQNVAGT